MRENWFSRDIGVYGRGSFGLWFIVLQGEMQASDQFLTKELYFYVKLHLKRLLLRNTLLETWMSDCDRTGQGFMLRWFPVKLRETN